VEKTIWAVHDLIPPTPTLLKPKLTNPKSEVPAFIKQLDVRSLAPEARVKTLTRCLLAADALATAVSLVEVADPLGVVLATLAPVAVEKEFHEILSMASE
jgi:hypothetical protein